MTKKKQTRKRKKQQHNGHTNRNILKYSLILVLVLTLGGGLLVYSVYAGLWGKIPTEN